MRHSILQRGLEAMDVVGLDLAMIGISPIYSFYFCIGRQITTLLIAQGLVVIMEDRIRTLLTGVQLLEALDVRILVITHLAAVDLRLEVDQVQTEIHLEGTQVLEILLTGVQLLLEEETTHSIVPQLVEAQEHHLGLVVGVEILLIKVHLVEIHLEDRALLIIHSSSHLLHLLVLLNQAQILLTDQELTTTHSVLKAQVVGLHQDQELSSMTSRSFISKCPKILMV